jgi:hypothetical protein
MVNLGEGEAVLYLMSQHMVYEVKINHKFSSDEIKLFHTAGAKPDLVKELKELFHGERMKRTFSKIGKRIFNLPFIKPFSYYRREKRVEQHNPNPNFRAGFRQTAPTKQTRLFEIQLPARHGGGLYPSAPSLQ